MFFLFVCLFENCIGRDLRKQETRHDTARVSFSNNLLRCVYKMADDWSAGIHKTHEIAAIYISGRLCIYHDELMDTLFRNKPNNLTVYFKKIKKKYIKKMERHIERLRLIIIY